MGKKAKGIRYPGFLYDRVAMWDSFLFLFRRRPELSASPQELGDKSLMVPGDRFTTIRGGHTSAGFTRVRMLPGCALEYAGSITDLTGTALCFRQVVGGRVEDMPVDGYAAAFIGWMRTGIDGCWVYSTPARAGGVVETTTIVRANGGGFMRRKKRKRPSCRPVLFSGPMVMAILAGEKTQTRRIVKPQPPAHHWEVLPGYKRRVSWLECNDGHIHARFQDSIPQNIDDPVWRKCPYGKTGDRLWVRETWWECVDNNDRPYYAATETPETTDRRHYRKRPSIFMRRAASRITLEILSIRVERVQGISRADAKAEVFMPGLNGLESWAGKSYGNAQLAFEACWKDINGLKSWEENPFVWVVEFRAV